MLLAASAAALGCEPAPQPTPAHLYPCDAGEGAPQPGEVQSLAIGRLYDSTTFAVWPDGSDLNVQEGQPSPQGGGTGPSLQFDVLAVGLPSSRDLSFAITLKSQADGTQLASDSASGMSGSCATQGFVIRLALRFAASYVDLLGTEVTMVVDGNFGGTKQSATVKGTLQ
jgi:hypothetical protein